MNSTQKFLLSLVVAMLSMLAFRALVFTLCTVDGTGLEPEFAAGDRVLVNRWSYGLRTGGKGGLFSYGRLWQHSVGRGDIVAFNDSCGKTVIGRCMALPGDTVSAYRRVVVPGLQTCALSNYYYVEPVGKSGQPRPGFISEEAIIGRVVMVVYSRQPSDRPFWDGYRRDRFLLQK